MADLKEIGHYTQTKWSRDQHVKYLTMLGRMDIDTRLSAK